MNQNTQNKANLKIIHLALFTGPMIFLGLCFTFLKDRPTQPNETIMNVALVFVFVAFFLSKKIPQNVKVSSSGNRASQYHIMKMIEWAVLEGAGLFNITVFFLTGSIYSAVAGGLVQLYLLSRGPSEKEMDKMIPK